MNWCVGGSIPSLGAVDEIGMKTCNRCKKEKPEEDFHFRDKKNGKRRAQCRVCIAESKGYKFSGPRKVFGEIRTCSRCKVDFPNNKDYFQIRSNGQIQSECRQCHNIRTKHARDKRRLEVLRHYSNGNPKCECCGENKIEFLAIDHVNGGGNKHRKEVKDMMLWLQKNDYPDGFRVLCHNCNVSRGLYGYCPHHEHHHHYVIVRNDLSFGIQSAMIVHAAGESGWPPPKTHAVCLVVENENELKNIESQLKNNRIKHKSIIESDEPYNNELMAIGIAPLIRSKNKELRRIVSGLKLLR